MTFHRKCQVLARIYPVTVPSPCPARGPFASLSRLFGGGFFRSCLRTMGDGMRFIMNELTTFTFIDAASGDEACVVIRYGDDSVAFAVSLSKDGDVEVVMRRQEL